MMDLLYNLKKKQDHLNKEKVKRTVYEYGYNYINTRRVLH
jgi:hypothetical protein